MSQAPKTIADIAAEATARSLSWPECEWSGSTVPKIERFLASLHDATCAMGPLLQILEIDLSLKDSEGYEPINDYIRSGLERSIRILNDEQNALLESIRKAVQS